ncbi:hypothetical protein HO133_005551 [Letharia lupina]|uniref:Uncharacterized protein n=1 Tax=Letharia lupina TaxID=560253 RepID=A0A8H6F8B8_9LECA|nr:uncharacterized protein HO133_005551 [Letharia lupina]KAF6219007.1 hypothetical protein HO133_005551 [Letharia lupina]
MSKPQHITFTEPSTPVEANHSARRTLKDRDNILHASQYADSTAPEGGYGWAVVFACFSISFWIVGTVYSWGVMQAALFKQGLSSPPTLSWIGSLDFACIAFLALVNARVIRLLGARGTALLGISMLALGEILSGFLTHNVGGLFVTAGVVSGIGTSLCFMVINVTPAQYFHKKRGLANGIVCAGGGLGGTVISLSMNAIIQRVGPAWTFRILGLLTLATGLPAAWLIKERCPIRSATFIEWKLFRDFKFVTIFLVGVVATFPLLVPPFFIPLYSASLGLSSSTGAALVAGFNISSGVGRLSSGLAADALGPLNTLFIGLFLTTVSMFVIWPVSDSLGPLVVFVIINGAANGAFFATMPTVVGTVFGSQRVSVAMGMVVTGWAGGYLMVRRAYLPPQSEERLESDRAMLIGSLQGAPIAGYLLEAHGGEKSTLAAYHPAMFWAGSLAVLAMGLVAMVRLYVNKDIMRRV